MRLALLLAFCVSVVPAFANPPGSSVEGTVEERLDSGGYSYLRLKTATGERWAAVPQVAVGKGEKVVVAVQAEMQNFQSPSLKRSWPVILFGTTAGNAGPAEAAAPAQPMKNPHEAGLPKTPPATPSLEGKVQETLVAGTYTYLRLATKDGETWAAVPKAEVKVGATVRIRSPQNMDGFTSPSLKRTFAKIVFGTLEQP